MGDADEPTADLLRDLQSIRTLLSDDADDAIPVLDDVEQAGAPKPAPAADQAPLADHLHEQLQPLVHRWLEEQIAAHLPVWEAQLLDELVRALTAPDGDLAGARGTAGRGDD